MMSRVSVVDRATLQSRTSRRRDGLGQDDELGFGETEFRTQKVVV